MSPTWKADLRAWAVEFGDVGHVQAQQVLALFAENEAAEAKRQDYIVVVRRADAEIAALKSENERLRHELEVANSEIEARAAASPFPPG